MDSVVTYLVTEPRQLPLLTTSIFSARRWWTGEIQVYGWPEVNHVVEKMATDKRLGISAHIWEPAVRNPNAYNLEKTRVVQSVDSDIAIFLWWNSLIRCDLAPLIDKSLIGFVATQYNGLPSRKPPVQLLHSEQPENISYKNLTHVKKALNGNIFSCFPNSGVLTDWYDLMNSLPESQESSDDALSLIVGKGIEEGAATIIDGNWNCSPNHTDPQSTKDVHVWNFEESLNLDPKKYNAAFYLWYPLFESCITTNIGFINEWIDWAGHPLPGLNKKKVQA